MGHDHIEEVSDELMWSRTAPKIENDVENILRHSLCEFSTEAVQLLPLYAAALFVELLLPSPLPPTRLPKD